MKESVPLGTKIVYHEYIDDETEEYVKAKGLKKEGYGFWLRFISEHFHPCDECQLELNTLIQRASNLRLGNKDYDPPIELWKKYDHVDEAWEEIERREPTKKDFISIYGAEKGARFWKDLKG